MATVIIYDSTGKSFQLTDKGTAKIGVGKALAGMRDPAVKVGDTIYLTIQFDAVVPRTTMTSDELVMITDEPVMITDEPVMIKDEPVMTKDGLTTFFQELKYADFFKFKTDSDVDDLNVKIISKNVSPITDVTSPVTITLSCLLELSNMIPGEKVINLLGYDSSRRLYDQPLAESDSFYLHQSLSEHFQKNIVNEGIVDLPTGLDRAKINSPSYLPIGLQPVNPLITNDVALWTVIRNGTEGLSFKRYSDFMDYLFCGKPSPFGTGGVQEKPFYDNLKELNNKRSLPFNNVDAYRALKVATEAFVVGSIVVYGVPDSDYKSRYNEYLEAVSVKNGSSETRDILPYLALIRQKLPDIDLKDFSFEDGLDKYLDNKRLLETCYGLLSFKLRFPCFLELIWSYWHEESMLVQGIGTIARRFQNIRGEGHIDPLANVEIGPLRPLNNLMWGYIQDEQHRLTIRRRAYEYDHHYGMTLQGTAVKGLRPADSRSKFIEAFHTLLNLCVKFYHQYDDTTVVADGFPIMNALKEVHMILSEGAHNQFGDLPSTARIEMLMQQYILARPEFREFLPARQMVAYPEAWMDRVGVLNQMHNWTKTNVLHFRDLGKFGEQIVLSIRFGAWSDVINRDQAANWAIFWRPQIQNYMHAYRAATGVDLTREDGVVDAQQPSYHLIRRLNEQNSKMRV